LEHGKDLDYHSASAKHAEHPSSVGYISRELGVLRKRSVDGSPLAAASPFRIKRRHGRVLREARRSALARNASCLRDPAKSGGASPHLLFSLLPPMLRLRTYVHQRRGTGVSLFERPVARLGPRRQAALHVAREPPHPGHHHHRHHHPRQTTRVTSVKPHESPPPRSDDTATDRHNPLFTLAVSFMDSLTPSWMSVGPRKRALPPRRPMPVSVDTRVRVERFWKIIATDLPSSFCSFCFAASLDIVCSGQRGGGGGGV